MALLYYSVQWQHTQRNEIAGPHCPGRTCFAKSALGGARVSVILGIKRDNACADKSVSRHKHMAAPFEVTRTDRAIVSWTVVHSQIRSKYIRELHFALCRLALAKFSIPGASISLNRRGRVTITTRE